MEEPQQRAEQQQGNSNDSKRPEIPTTEPRCTNQDKESEPTTEHQDDEHNSLKLTDNLRVFIKANRELLMKEGITLENDEARLDNKTLVKLGESEGFTIIYENQYYKITTVEKEKIGNLELHKYRTKQGEEFLHVPKENMIIPPYETEWYALPRAADIYLDKEYKRELLEAALDKAGGQVALREEMRKKQTRIGASFLRDHLHGRVDGMTVEKLMLILAYLGRGISEPNRHITAIGCGRAVENPNLPLNLNNIDGARLLAARFSDGSLYVSQGKGPVFDYGNNDANQRKRIAESITNVFGEARILNRGKVRALCGRVRTSTYVIGRTLQRSGAIAGEIVRQNPEIPAFILQGSKELKREWLRQAFGDEGSTWPQRGLVKLSRAVNATHRLSDQQRDLLDASKEWKRKLFTDACKKQIKYCRFSDLPRDIQETLKLEYPRLLESEAKMLREDFGINSNSFPNEVYEGEAGYSVNWVLQTTSRRDSRIFCSEIGFPQNRKQKVLEDVLKMKGVDRQR
ncbi:MAG: hypothetical protein WED04_04625 [Promethearchaeati archaeon SRVP18_Atabeyarchaeia-1]